MDEYESLCNQGRDSLKNADETINHALDNYSKIKKNKKALKLLKDISLRMEAISEMLTIDPETYDKKAFAKKHPIVKKV